MSESGAPFYGYLCKEAGCSVSYVRNEKSMEYLSYVISSFTLNGNAADAVMMMKKTGAMTAASVVDPANALMATAAAVAAGALIYIYRHRRIR